MLRRRRAAACTYILKLHFSFIAECVWRTTMHHDVRLLFLLVPQKRISSVENKKNIIHVFGRSIALLVFFTWLFGQKISPPEPSLFSLSTGSVLMCVCGMDKSFLIRLSRQNQKSPCTAWHAINYVQVKGKKKTPRPWRPPPPHGHYGAPPAALRHTSDNPHSGQQVYVAKTR